MCDWMMASNGKENVWKSFVFPLSIFLFFLILSLFTSTDMRAHTDATEFSLNHNETQACTRTHTHTCTQTHAYSYTSRNRGSNSLAESLSPHVDNVTFLVFHYLVLTIREHLFLSPSFTRLLFFSPSLLALSYFGISDMFERSRHPT